MIRNIIAVIIALISAMSGAADNPTPDPVVVRLKHVSNLQSQMWTTVSWKGAGDLLRGPDTKGAHIIKGFLPLAVDGESSVGYALDDTNEKLYVDYDHDLDLSDEKAITRAQSPSEVFGFQFDIAVSTGTVNRSYTLKMYHLNSHSVGVSSGWTGMLEIGGTKSAVTIIDDTDGVITGHDYISLTSSPLTSNSPSSQFVHFPAQMSVGERIYDIATSFDAPTSAGAVSDLLLTLKPAATPAGKVRLVGPNVKLITALDMQTAARVLVVAPQQTFVLPKGIQRVEIVALNSEAATYSAGDTMLHIGDGEPPELACGGELKPEVQVRSSWGVLWMDYSLADAYGHSYHPASYQSPPTFQIYRGDRLVHSGKFEYG